MPSIETLIGKRFETILQEMYSELRYIGDEGNKVPDFEHPLFYAEAKVAYFQRDFAIHLKQYQIESFKELNKPVLYLIGFHNFEGAIKRLTPLSQRGRETKLSREMELLQLFIVDNSTVTNIWNRRNYICKKGHIKDCTVREGHLRQIIEDSKIQVFGKDYTAREFYNVPSDRYSFSLPTLRKSKKMWIGHIVPKGSEEILEYFYN